MNFSSENIENENSSSTFLSIEQSKEAETTTKRTLLTSNTHDEPSNTICGLCNKEPGKKTARWVKCDECNKWFLV